MTYMIDARLEQGTPSLKLIDVATGEERLYWRGDNAANSDWRGLFKRLILLSCADRLSLIQRAKSSVFGDECVECNICVEQDVLTEIQADIISTEIKKH